MIGTRILKSKPSRVRDAVGLLMLVLTAALLWSESREQVAGVGVDEQVDVLAVVGAQPAAPVIFAGSE